MLASPGFIKAAVGDGHRCAAASGYAYEVKFDGYRMVCRIDEAGPRFFSRDAKDWTRKLSDLVERIRALTLGGGLTGR